jgi:hypothetical protein
VGGPIYTEGPIADVDHSVLLRDSKHPEQEHFTFSRAEVAAFVAGVKAGEFGDLMH